MTAPERINGSCTRCKVRVYARPIEDGERWQEVEGTARGWGLFSACCDQPHTHQYRFIFVPDDGADA